MGQSNTRERPPWAASVKKKPPAHQNRNHIHNNRQPRSQAQQRTVNHVKKAIPQPVRPASAYPRAAAPPMPIPSEMHQEILRELEEDSNFGNAKQLVKPIKIERDSKHTYESLFGPFMGTDLTVAIIDEPYMSRMWQFHNLVRFIECCVVNAPSLKLIKLVTKETENPEEQQANLNELAENLLLEWGITLVVEYKAGLHDRYIAFNNGFLITLGKGLHFYQRGGTQKHFLGMFDMRLRKCEETNISIHSI